MGEVAEKQDGSAAAVQWERYLPRTALRVLLVEADDSTRQIISALLRKCSYKVSAVPDGLRAWQILKGKQHNIDLVLTEVELPSISGFALLTLVMEHDACKNIPVIMMSSHHSISMVLKCTLKGAADFLIKPVRKNELKNLWQHVWRRHTLTGGYVPPNLNATQHKVEAGTDNNTASNHSSDYVVSSCEDKDISEKGGDAQVSIAENPSKFGSNVALRLQEDHDCVKSMTRYESLGSESEENDNIKSESSGNRGEVDEPLSGAFDFIGTFDDRPPVCSHVGSGSTNGGSQKFECTPQLELSLRRFCPKDDKTDEGHALNHSNASAISWYNNSKTLHSFFPTMAELEEGADKIRDLLSSHCSETTIDASQNWKQGYDQRSDETLNNQIVNEEKSFEAMEESRRDVSSCTGQSCSTSLCNGDGMSGAVMEQANASDNSNDGGLVCQDGLRVRGSVRSEREAALTKFRLKRKDRCYEKKVRYQSRKRLAEQRPRVKGQFVRQAQTNVAGANG